MNEYNNFSQNEEQLPLSINKPAVKKLSNKSDNNLSNVNETIHPNSLITKNISLFTKNPNYKMLAWLITQLLIFSLFIFSVSIFRDKLIPYLNNI